jgi:hypothetical protein
MVDLRSGRKFPEFEFPGPREEWQRAELINWRAFLSDRGFKSPCGAIGDARSPEEMAIEERSIRHISSVFTYPLTIAHAIYWHNALGDPAKLDRRNGDGNLIPWRITVLGPRAEATLPIRAWLELCAIFPEAAFDLHLVGPEIPEKMHQEVAEVHNNRLTITWTRGLYQVRCGRLDAPRAIAHVSGLCRPQRGKDGEQRVARRTRWSTTTPRTSSCSSTGAPTSIAPRELR